MTYLEIVNKALIRLRQSEVSGVQASTYAKMLGELVNQSKREIEDAHDWLALHDVFTITTAATDDTYTLTDWGERYRIRYIHDTTLKGTVRPIFQRRFDRDVDFSTTTGPPKWWRIWQQVGPDPQVQFFPEPSDARTIKVYGTVAQDDLSADTDEPLIPYYPLVLGAYALAVAERGEHGGGTHQEATAAYLSALNDAIATDAMNNAGGFQSDWRVE